MKFLYPLLLLFLVSLAPARGQGVDRELSDLRAQLSVDASYKIELAPATVAPAGDPLRVYLALGLDMQARINLETAIAKWNKGNAKKHGRIDLVTDLAAADIILARYRRTDDLKTATGTSSTVVSGSVWDPAQNRMVTAPVSKVRSDTSTIVPAFGYILAKRPEGAAIIYRYTTTAPIDEDKKSGTWLTDALFKMMKSRKN